jgi:excinuclease UvrABC nuclease subunit
VNVPDPVQLIVSAALDAELEVLPNAPAVFAVWTREGEPYLARTALLRRRLKRLLRAGETTSRVLRLRAVAERIEYWPTGSNLESLLVFYGVSRQYLPERYLETLKLRMPFYVKLLLANPYPRTHVTSKLTGGPARFYGPFRSRAAAEQFEHAVLDLFQIRRCQEDLEPHPEHPGCVYGEMNMCLRPCQQQVSSAEYASEVSRVGEFLRSSGRTALQTSEAARERLSIELEFEAAAREHKRFERIQEALKLREGLARDIDVLAGAAVTAGSQPATALIWHVRGGCWQSPDVLDLGMTAEAAASVDSRLRTLFETPEPVVPPLRERQEHLALLTRWFHSSYRDGEWIEFDPPERVPYRKLVNAVSRVVHHSSPAASH